MGLFASKPLKPKRKTRCVKKLSGGGVLWNDVSLLTQTNIDDANAFVFLIYTITENLIIVEFTPYKEDNPGYTYKYRVDDTEDPNWNAYETPTKHKQGAQKRDLREKFSFVKFIKQNTSETFNTETFTDNDNLLTLLKKSIDLKYDKDTLQILNRPKYVVIGKNLYFSIHVKMQRLPSSNLWDSQANDEPYVLDVDNKYNNIRDMTLPFVLVDASPNLEKRHEITVAKEPYVDFFVKQYLEQLNSTSYHMDPSNAPYKEFPVKYGDGIKSGYFSALALEADGLGKAKGGKPKPKPKPKKKMQPVLNHKNH